MAHLSETSSRTRALRYAVPVFAGLLLLGACSKKDDTTTTSNTTQAGSSSGTKAPTTGGTTTGTGGTTTGTGGTTTGTGVDANKALDQTVWSQGFKIALGDITMDKTAKTVSIAATIENLGVNNASPNSTYSMEVDGAVAYTGYWKDSVTVVAGSKAKDALEFGVDDKYSAAKTTLVIGSGTEAQVRIPMAGGGEATTLKPVDQLALKEPVVVGNVTLSPSVAQVRWDDPASHAQAEKGKAFLIIKGKAKNASPDDYYYTNARLVVLTLPDGTKSTSDSFEVNDGLAPTKNNDYTIVFTIPTPYAGKYSMSMDQEFGTGVVVVTASLNFELTKEEAKTSGSTPPTTKK